MKHLSICLFGTAVSIACALGCSQKQETLQKDIVPLKQEQPGFLFDAGLLVYPGQTVGIAVTDYWSYLATENAGAAAVTRYRSTSGMPIDFTQSFTSATGVEVVDIAASSAGYAVLLKSSSAIDINGQSYSGAGVVAVFSHCNDLQAIQTITPYIPSASFDPTALAMDTDGRVAVLGNSIGPVDFGNGNIAVGGSTGGSIERPVLGVYAADGSVAFAHSSSGASHLFGMRSKDVAFDSSGRVVTAGEHRSGASFGPCGGGGIPYAKPHVMRFNTDGSCAGSHEWPVSVNIELQHSFTDELAVAAGSVVIRGQLPYNETIDFGAGPLLGPGEFLARFDENMNLIYAQKIKPMDFIAARDDGHVMLASSFGSTLDMGLGPIYGSGTSSIALTELDATGAVIDSDAIFPNNTEQFPTGLAVFPNSSLLQGRIMLIGRYYTYPTYSYDMIIGMSSE